MQKDKQAVQGAVTDARTLGAGKMFILGLQHLFAMFGATVLVPILTGLSVQVTLACAGVGTLLFHAFTKFRVPAFLGSSFAFLGGFTIISQMSSGIYATLSPTEKLAYACGGIVVAGLIYLLMALLIKVVGVGRVMRFLPPVVTGPIIILIGLILAPTAVANASTNWWLALLAVTVIIVCNIFGKGMIKIIPILLGVVVPYLIALAFNLVDFTQVADAAWLGLPPFQMAKFDISAILVMTPIAIAAMMEHIGDMSAISATVGKNFMADPGLHRSLMGDGLATALSALFGGPANTTYGENTGVLVLSKVYDPRVVRLAAYFAIVLSLFPKFAGLVYSIPTAIIGGVSFILYGMISAVGVRNVVENRVDFTKSRNLIIAAVVLVSGLGFNGFGGLSFAIGTVNITLSGLAIAALLGILLNAVLPGNDYQFGTHPDGDSAADLGKF